MNIALVNLILIPLLLLIYYKVRNWEMVNCKIEIQFFGLSMKTNIRTMSVCIKLFLCFCLGWAQCQGRHPVCDGDEGTDWGWGGIGGIGAPHPTLQPIGQYWPRTSSV